MKSLAQGERATVLGRAPQGARGLKLDLPDYAATRAGSRPARGAWIEME